MLLSLRLNLANIFKPVIWALAVKVSMDELTKNSVNKLAMVVGCIIAIQGFNLNFITSLAISFSLVIIASSLFGKPLREAIQSGAATKEDITKGFFSAPYIWAGLFCFVLLAVLY